MLRKFNSLNKSMPLDSGIDLFAQPLDRISTALCRNVFHARRISCAPPSGPAACGIDCWSEGQWHAFRGRIHRHEQHARRRCACKTCNFPRRRTCRKRLHSCAIRTCGHNCAASISDVFCNCVFCSRSKPDAFSYTSTNGVILISRQRNSSQNTDDRDDDHQFNQGKTLLHVARNGTTVHFKYSRLVVQPGFPVR